MEEPATAVSWRNCLQKGDGFQKGHFRGGAGPSFKLPSYELWKGEEIRLGVPIGLYKSGQDEDFFLSRPCSRGLLVTSTLLLSGTHAPQGNVNSQG